MSPRLAFVVVSALAASLAVAADEYPAVQRKIDRIESDTLARGARVELTPGELSAYAAHQAPEGVRDVKLSISAPEIATGAAVVDFEKLGRGQGWRSGHLLGVLLGGERPISVTARIRSSGGQATVDVHRVVIGGLEIQGATLDFLIRTVLMPLYPDAKIGKPFELSHRIERLDVQPRGVGVVIGR